MKEYENNSSTYNNNHENNIVLSIATSMINFHISFTLERNRLIENYFMSLTDYMEGNLVLTTGLKT